MRDEEEEDLVISWRMKEPSCMKEEKKKGLDKQGGSMTETVVE